MITSQTRAPPLTATVIVRVFYIYETTSPPIPPPIPRQRRRRRIILKCVKNPSTYGQKHPTSPANNLRACKPAQSAAIVYITNTQPNIRRSGTGRRQNEWSKRSSGESRTVSRGDDPPSSFIARGNVRTSRRFIDNQSLSMTKDFGYRTMNLQLVLPSPVAIPAALHLSTYCSTSLSARADRD